MTIYKFRLLLRKMVLSERDHLLKETYTILGLSVNQLINEGDLYIKDSYDDEEVREMIFDRFFKCSDFVKRHSLKELIDIT